MTRDELEQAKVEGLWVKTPYGFGRMNGIGNRFSFVEFGSNDEDTICLLREVLNDDIELAPAMGDLLARQEAQDG